METQHHHLKCWPPLLRPLPSDPRFHYVLYIPCEFFDDSAGYSLVVPVHGTGRGAAGYRNAFMSFARANRCIVLAPLFPADLLGDANLDGYRYLLEGDIRYDLILLDMIRDLETACGYDFSKFLLFGFSGGGQFVHRFLYLHPDRLRAISIGGSGAIRRIDDQSHWWFGTKDVAGIFRCPDRAAEIRKVPIQIVSGTQSRQARPKSLGKFVPLNERLRMLKADYATHGIHVQLDYVTAVLKSGLDVLPTVESFFTEVLAIDGSSDYGNANGIEILG